MLAAVHIGVAVASVCALLGVMALVRHFATQRGWSAELQRKLVHICTGMFAMVLPLIFRQDWPIYLLLGLTFVAMIAMRLPRFGKSGISATLHNVERRSYGDFFLATSVGLVLLLSEREMLLYILPLAVLTLSDAAAALAGSTYGRRFFIVEDGQKSVEGSAVFFLVTLLIAMICLLLLSDIPRPNVIVIATLIAAFGTLVEADSWRGFDNLFLPVGILIFLMTYIDRPLVDLGLVLGAYVVALVAFHALAPRLGFSNHAARVYLAAIFLILSIAAVHNTVLPLTVLVLHAVAGTKRPGADPYPALDSVATVAVISFGWLALGNSMGANALHFYGMSMAGLGVGLMALSIPRRRKVIYVVGLVASGLGLLVVYRWLMAFNTADTHWAGDVTPVAVLSLLGVGAVVALFQDGFNTLRGAKLGGLAVAVPLAAYIMLGLQTGAFS